MTPSEFEGVVLLQKAVQSALTTSAFIIDAKTYALVSASRSALKKLRYAGIGHVLGEDFVELMHKSAMGLFPNNLAHAEEFIDLYEEIGRCLASGAVRSLVAWHGILWNDQPRLVVVQVTVFFFDGDLPSHYLVEMCGNPLTQQEYNAMGSKNLLFGYDDVLV